MYIKSKEEKHVLQLMSLPAQSGNLYTIELMGDEQDRKSELNNPQVRLTSGHSCKQAVLDYHRFTSSLWWQEYRESVKQ